MDSGLRRMFRVIILVALLSILFLFRGEKDAEKAYQMLEESSKKGCHDQQPLVAEQDRKGVQKHVWYENGDEHPLYFLVDSQQSELCCTKADGAFEIVEHLHDVVCFVQEECFYLLPTGKEQKEYVPEGRPMQRIRYIKAETATYHYTSQVFTAENVKLWQCQLEGHTPPTLPINCGEPIISAVAQSVTFKLKEKKPQFTAHELRANIRM